MGTGGRTAHTAAAPRRSELSRRRLSSGCVRPCPGHANKNAPLTARPVRAGSYGTGNRLRRGRAAGADRHHAPRTLVSTRVKQTPRLYPTSQVQAGGGGVRGAEERSRECVSGTQLASAPPPHGLRPPLWPVKGHVCTHSRSPENKSHPHGPGRARRDTSTPGSPGTCDTPTRPLGSFLMPRAGGGVGSSLPKCFTALNFPPARKSNTAFHLRMWFQSQKLSGQRRKAGTTGPQGPSPWAPRGVGVAGHPGSRCRRRRAGGSEQTVKSEEGGRGGRRKPAEI